MADDGLTESSYAKSEARKRSNANLRPFKTDQSGNPGGRKKKRSSRPTRGTACRKSASADKI